MNFFSYADTSAMGLECEYYNNTECKSDSKESCMKTKYCGEDESSKSYSCYSIWQIKQGGKESLEYKGCFLNNKDCLGKESCVDTSAGRMEKNTNTTTLYCCCMKDFCNKQYDWVPGPTTTTVKRMLS